MSFKDDWIESFTVTGLVSKVPPSFPFILEVKGAFKKGEVVEVFSKKCLPEIYKRQFWK